MSMPEPEGWGSIRLGAACFCMGTNPPRFEDGGATGAVVACTCGTGVAVADAGATAVAGWLGVAVADAPQAMRNTRNINPAASNRFRDSLNRSYRILVLTGPRIDESTGNHQLLRSPVQWMSEYCWITGNNSLI